MAYWGIAHQVQITPADLRGLPDDPSQSTIYRESLVACLASEWPPFVRQFIPIRTGEAWNSATTLQLEIGLTADHSRYVAELKRLFARRDGSILTYYPGDARLRAFVESCKRRAWEDARIKLESIAANRVLWLSALAAITLLPTIPVYRAPREVVTSRIIFSR